MIESPFEVQTDTTALLSWIKSHPVFGVDTETTGEWNARNKILSLQIGDANTQWVLDWQSLSREEKDGVLAELANPLNVKIFQNAKFDAKFLFQEGCFPQTIFDVMIAECLIHAGKDMEKGRYTLATIAKNYTGMVLDKSIRGRIHAEGLSNRVIIYAAQDVECLPSIMRQQHDILQNLGMANENHQDELTVLGIENRSCLCLALMEYNGMKVDLDKWTVLTAQFAEELVILEKQLDDMVFADTLFEGIGKRQMDLFGGNSTGINWKSPQQKLALLQRINPKIEDTSERSVSKHKNEHQLIPLMQRYIKLTKLYTGFALTLPKMINKTTGRIHTSFWQNLKTGRISASDPNLLQIPGRTTEGKAMRECFVPEPGNILVGGDYSGCELRIIAELSQDPLWLDVFNKNGDLHSELCVKTFGIPLSDVKKISHFKEGISYRDIQKTVDFG